MEVGGRILGWIGLAAIVYVVLVGSAPKYLSYLGI